LAPTGGASVNREGYTRHWVNQTQERFAQLYVNVPAAAAKLFKSIAEVLQGLAQLQDNQGLATTITLNPEGILFKSISWPNGKRVHVVENKGG